MSGIFNDFPGDIPTRFIRQIGHRYSARFFWQTPDKKCGDHGATYHAGPSFVFHEDANPGMAYIDFNDLPPLDVTKVSRVCSTCGAVAPEDEWVSRSGSPRYDTASGEPEPGDIWESPWHHEHFCEWDNCDGKHYVCKLPDGVEWEITSRANNCGSPQDRLHRCWVLTFPSPGVFHVAKDGLTCAAGAGSIATARYHGFLHMGHLVKTP